MPEINIKSTKKAIRDFEAKLQAIDSEIEKNKKQGAVLYEKMCTILATLDAIRCLDKNFPYLKK